MTNRKQKNINNYFKKIFYGKGEKKTYNRWKASSYMAIFIGIMAIIISVAITYYQSKTIRAINTLERESCFKPIISFDLKGNENKEDPSFDGDGRGVEYSEFQAYGDKGFKIKWKKEKKEWLALQWRVKRKNFEEDRHNYFLYFKGRAKKNEWIAINLMDKEKQYAQIDIELSPQITKKIIPLINIKKYFKDEIIPETNQTEAKDTKKFNWASVEIVSISPIYDHKVDNEIVCEKMSLLWLDLNLIEPSE